MPAPLKALDLFAGTGWGVACQRLGIEEMGVEIMPEAVATREANGMTTIYRDVWEGLGDAPLDYDILIASPPCQTFSMAGKGAGRAALDAVLGAITTEAYKDPEQLIAFGEEYDPRTALVLTPLAHVWRDRPRLVAMEQVPTVLPVWEACAAVMRGWGYDVKVANLQAEQYGVPQTRKRAILVARLDGPVSLPTPTHSRYYSRTPDKLDEGVAKWVSMAEALGWGGFTAEKVMGQGMVTRHGTRPGRDAATPAFAIRASAGGMEPGGFVLRSNYGTGGDASKRGERKATEPSATLTSKADRMKWDGTRRLTAEEAAALQSYPTWVHERPAPTIVGTRRSEGGMLVGRQLDDDSRRDVGGRQTSVGLRPGMLPGVRVSGDEGAKLQSYPQPFVWKGSKSKQFLQIGNAVPPLLAQAVLSALIAD